MAKAKKSDKVSVSDLRSKYGRPDTEFRSSGVFVLDDLWGGGLPSGKMIEIHSDPGYGKTTLCLQIAKHQIGNGFPVAFMDVEQALDPALKKSVGVDKFETQLIEGVPAFLHVSPSYFSEVEETTLALIEEGYKLIIYDSLTMTVLDSRVQGSITDGQLGQHARLQGEFLNRFKVEVARAGASMILLNQMRANMDFFSKAPSKPAGGYALQFAADIRTSLLRKRWIEDKGERVGAELEITTIKNKITTPFRRSKVMLYFGHGVNNTATLADLMVERGIVTRSGAYYSVPNNETKIQGLNALMDWVRSNREFCMASLSDKIAVDDGNPQV